MKNIFTLLFLCFMLSIAHAQTNITIKPETPKGGSSFPSGEAFKNAEITYHIITAPNNTWCYDIFTDGKLTIHQGTIPALPGNEGFKTKEQAGKVAEFVISKMKRGEMPPSVTIEELKKLKAL